MTATTEKEIYDLLNTLGITYERIDHFAISSVKNVDIDLPCPQVKNLVLKAKKGKRLYLVILHDEKQADLKHIAEKLDEKRLSFASEDTLKEVLGVCPGAVTPLALIQDVAKKITVIIDSEVDVTDTVGFHPGVNTTTLIMQYQEFLIYLHHLGYEPIYIHV